MKDLHLDDELLSTYLRWWGVAMFSSVFLLGYTFRMWPVSVTLLYLIYQSPPLILDYLLERRAALMRDQMVGASVGVANACRAGLTIGDSVETVSSEMPKPLALEFQRITRDCHAGRPLAEAIRATRDRLNLDGFTLFASAVLVCIDRGGRVTDALDEISTTLQENQRLERKLEADTASGRKVAIILGAFPFLFLGFFYLVFPEGTGLLFSTLIGQFILAGILAVVYYCSKWCKSILTLQL